MIKNSGTFFRAQLSSALASITDFSVTFVLSSVFNYWYVYTSFLGTVAGGATNFYINRYWAFRSKKQSKKRQGLKYFIVWTGSMLLNLSGVVFLTEVLNWHYLMSKAFTAGVVGFFFNFLLQQNFVFVKTDLLKKNA